DAGIRHEARNVGVPELRHLRVLEIGKGGAEVLALAQDRQPAEPRHEALQAELLEQPAVVLDRTAPLLVVVGEIDRVRGAPPAAGPPAGPDTDPGQAGKKTPGGPGGAASAARVGPGSRPWGPWAGGKGG